MLSICNIRLDIYLYENINNFYTQYIIFVIICIVCLHLYSQCITKIIYFVLPSNWFQLLMKSLEFKTCPY